MLLLGCANEKHQGHTEPNYPALFPARITHSWFWQRCCRGCVCLSIRSPNSLVFDFWVAQQNKPAAQLCPNIQRFSALPLRRHPAGLSLVVVARRCQQCLFGPKWAQKGTGIAVRRWVALKKNKKQKTAMDPSQWWQLCCKWNVFNLCGKRKQEVTCFLFYPQQQINKIYSSRIADVSASSM